MLGRFLEVALHAPAILESWHFYQRLGFASATVGEIWPHRYAVVTDGRIALGLHDRGVDAPLLSYVLPDLARHLARLEARGIEFESRTVGDAGFNAAVFAAPDGQRVRLLEARTYSPPEGALPSLLGWFEEYAVPVGDLGAAREFWEGCGFVTAAEDASPWPHLALTSDSLNIGLHDTRELKAPTLVFGHDDVAGLRAQLAAAGVACETRLPRALDPRTHLLVIAPEGTRLLVGPPPG
jgi:hypothetical protein